MEIFELIHVFSPMFPAAFALESRNVAENKNTRGSSRMKHVPHDNIL